MLKVCPTIGFASVSTLPKTTRPFSRLAASINVGAKPRHGPHQEAQKSTTTGSGLFWERVFKVETFRVFTPSFRGSEILHFPHTGDLPSGNENATRLSPPHFSHIEYVTASLIKNSSILRKKTLSDCDSNSLLELSANFYYLFVKARTALNRLYSLISNFYFLCFIPLCIPFFISIPGHDPPIIDWHSLWSAS